MSNLMSRYYREASLIPLLSRERERELADQIAAGGEKAFDAWTEMVEGNLRLVMKIANFFIRRGMEMEDLVAWGNIGLFEAAWRYRSDRGVKFSTYAKWWIERSIRRAINEQGSMAFLRISSNIRQKAMKVERYIENHVVEFGVIPDVEQISEGTGFTESQIAILRDILVMKRVSVEALAEREFAPSMDNPYKNVEKSDSINMLRAAMQKLDPRMRTIINHRFTINGAPHKTLKELRVMFDITSERVRQLEVAAKQELRRICEEMEMKDVPI